MFGVREVERASEANLIFDDLFVCETASAEVLSGLQSQIRDSSTRLSILASDVFSKVTYGDRVDGVVAVGPRPSTDLDQISLATPLLVVVAQAIEKPGNLGAIIRSADACAASAVLLADPVTDVFHPNSIRSSTGAVFGMPLGTGSSEEVQTWLAVNRCRVFTAVLQNASDCFAADLTGDIAIVVGNEAGGLSTDWQKEAYVPVKLPMHGNADSLNVSVTASVMIYEALRQRVSSER